jgi:DnaJ-class molecular chaperone
MPGGARAFHFNHQSAEDIFRQFFGTSDPFAAGGGDDSPFGGGGGPFGGGFPFMMGGMPGGMAGGMPRNGGSQRAASSSARTKAPPVNHTLNVTLEELYTGTTKRMRITSKRIIDSSGNTQQVSSDKEIQVKPGWKNGTKITFENEGDEAPGIIPADIVFTLQTKPHDRFERDGDDLIYTVCVFPKIDFRLV